MGKILSIFALGVATLIGGSTLFSAAAESSEQTAPDELISPSSYEQYLELAATADVAVNERYTAIADGNVIYVYDKTDKIYREYTHEVNADKTKNRVTKLQFSDNGDLFFSDAIPSLHQLDPHTATLNDVYSDLVCNSFLLSGNYIYTGSVSSGISSVSKNSLSDLNRASGQPIVTGINSGAVPILAVNGKELFYTKAGDVLYKYLENDPNNPNDDSQENVCDFPGTVDSLIVTESVLCCTVDNVFYVYDYATLIHDRALPETPLYSEKGNFEKLSLYDGRVYAVDGNSVRCFSIKENAFTDYEICSSSTKANRLDGATDVLFHQGKILTADAGNKRVTVREQNGDYRTISTANELNGQKSQSLAATEDTVLVWVDDAAYLYALTASPSPLLASFKFGESKLAGVAGIYGKYYFVTNNNGYYVAEQTETQDWKLSSPVTKTGSAPTDLTSDVYGNLYVTRANDVYKYDQTEFLDKENAGESLGSIPSSTKNISVDYGGNLYALTENSLLRYEHGSWSESAITLNKSAVYSKSPSLPIALSFGVEENETFVLYNGSYILKTAALDLPTVRTIDVNETDDAIFSTESAVFSVVQTKENALLILFDFNELNGAEHFPYETLLHSKNARTALKIGETPTHYVLAEYDKTKRSYLTYLVRSQDCAPFAENEYLTKYDETEGNEVYGYLTNNVHTYKFPYLTSLLSIDSLEKNAKVQLLGEITQLDHDYYHVKYQTEDGEKTGYIPKSYVTDFDGSTPETEKHVLDGAPADDDIVWRLAYILCGFAAIFILTDYLILRKKPHDKN